MGQIVLFALAVSQVLLIQKNQIGKIRHFGVTYSEPLSTEEPFLLLLIAK